MIKYIVKDSTMIGLGFTTYESEYFDSYEEALKELQLLEHIDKEIGENHNYYIEEVMLDEEI